MNQLSIGRSLYGIATFGALLAAGATISLMASARQSPPSPAQAKQSAQAVPTQTSGKQTPLPGKQTPLPGIDTSGTSSSVGSDAQKQASLDMIALDSSEKSGIARGTNVVYVEGDMKFTGMTAVYNKNSKELDAQGNLVLDDPKHHVTGDKSHVDRKKQLAIIKGNVVITLKPTPPDPTAPVDPDNAKQRKDPVIITCDRADDSYKKDFILLTGHLVFKQKITKDDGKQVERTLTADHAEYDGKTNTLHLFQTVKGHDSEGQTSDFEKDVFVGTKEGEETLTSPGKVIVHFNLDDTADDAAEEKPEKQNSEKQTPAKKPPEKKDTPPPSSKQPN